MAKSSNLRRSYSKHDAKRFALGASRMNLERKSRPIAIDNAWLLVEKEIR